MQDIIIDEEFRFLLPALDDDTFARLEELYKQISYIITIDKRYYI